MKTLSYQAFGLLAAVLLLAACGGQSPNAAPAASEPTKAAPVAANSAQASPIPAASQAQATPVATTAAAGEVAGVEGGGGEAALVTYADAAQGFAIDYPKPWTKDPAMTDGVKFVGDGTFTLVFVKPTMNDVMAFATADAKTFAASQPGYKQVGLAASTEVTNAVVLGFEATGRSNVTGKTFAARGDRYYIPLKDGRIAVFTVISPVKNYDREGIRDMALTLKVTK